MQPILFLLSLVGFVFAPAQPKVLVFTKTQEYHHSSIETGARAIMRLGKLHHFAVDTTSDANKFQEDSLKKYAAVVFISTTGELLNASQQADFERYIQSGGGYVGIHAASDAEYDWPWYGKLVGGYFNGHPQIQQALIDVVDSTYMSTKHLPRIWTRTDEWYNFRNLNPEVHVLLTIGESSYQGGENGGLHPMAWYHEYDGGRAWYTELGHTEESFSDPLYLQHLLGGIEYAIGTNVRDYTKAKSLRVPEESHFTKRMLVNGVLYEPTEMTILPNKNILIAQRRGELLQYSTATKKVKQVGKLPVYWKALTKGGSTEDGLLGLQADPDFAANHYLYLYYAPIDSSVDRLSRFTYVPDTLDLATEKVILEVKTDREICCHTGGSIAFGKGHDLFVSTGDNTTPFDQTDSTTPYKLHGFAPLDERPGFSAYDDQRGAGNTNDLRGKILRISIKPDGGYEIPDGNLFPVGTDKTRPEIYVMGNRNPYRISVDRTTGFLYWGEVGPDAADDSLESRGPRGYDEINQARKAGNFGWPYFIGNNYPYRAYDFTNGRSGAAFDPAAPRNVSLNNTGLEILPPAQPAFIWYPYGESTEYPQVGSGGRTAMAGPVYRGQYYPKYYQGKLFVYDWMRDWIKVVTMKDSGDYVQMEPFMEHTKFDAVIDMEAGLDGNIYLLEYGHGWYAQNKDAGLSVIEYAPKAAVKKDSATVVQKQMASRVVVDPVVVQGRALVQTLDCKSCHKESEKSIGPSFTDVSKKYSDAAASDYLVQKIVKGGSGVWGDVAMPAHPATDKKQLSQIVEYILKLSKK